MHPHYQLLDFLNLHNLIDADRHAHAFIKSLVKIKKVTNKCIVYAENVAFETFIIYPRNIVIQINENEFQFFKGSNPALYGIKEKQTLEMLQGIDFEDNMVNILVCHQPLKPSFSKTLLEKFKRSSASEPN